MKIAILGDIHANLEAFETVLSEIDKNSPEKIFCVGAVIGYGSDPGPCLNLIKERDIPFVIGNWEFAINDADAPEMFNPFAQASIYWTRGALSFEEKEYLSTIPKGIQEAGFEIAHARPGDCISYILNPDDAKETFKLTSSPVIFVGHTHISMSFLEEEPIKYVEESDFSIPENTRAIINVGSVGQPRDGDSRASYCLYDTESRNVRIIRCEYDVQKAAQKIEKAGIPKKLGERLLLGK